MQTNLQPSGITKKDGVVNASGGTAMPQSWLEGGMAVLDEAGRVMEANEALSSWLDKRRGEFVGQDFWELLGNFSPKWKMLLKELRQRDVTFERLNLLSNATVGQPAQSFALEVARTNGSCFVRLNSVLPSRAELEEGGWDEHLQNDSARREMFMRLLRTEAQLDRLMRRWPCVVFSQRPDFSLQFASPNIEEVTGIPTADWLSQPRRFWELVHETDAGELQQQFKRATETGADIMNTYRIRHARTGRVVYVLEHRQPTLSQNKLLLGYEVVWLDVTRQTIAEKRLSAAAWKETLAVLTLGMAHDFRNMMAGIHSLGESFLSQVDAQHPFAEGLSLITKSSMQASQLVQRMINLHLGQTGERNYHNLNEFATDLVELVAKILPRRIRMGTELAAESLPVYVDVVELRQVVINLLLNAADAMPDGGTLTLRTSRHMEMPALENMRGVNPRLPCVCLTIEDTGCGIKERHLASIFDPFFTTKSKGSGLGLYNARLAVEKHQGAISVRSKEGAETTFQVWLPETDFSEPSPDVIAARPNAVARRSLLLVGHSGDVFDQTAEFLRSNNYHVVGAMARESLPELLQSGDYQFSAVVVLAEPNDPALRGCIEEIQGQKKKIVLKIAGCTADDLDAQLLKTADLVLNSELPNADVLGELESFLNRTGAH